MNKIILILIAAILYIGQDQVLDVENHIIREIEYGKIKHPLAEALIVHRDESKCTINKVSKRDLSNGSLLISCPESTYKIKDSGELVLPENLDLNIPSDKMEEGLCYYSKKKDQSYLVLENMYQAEIFLKDSNIVIENIIPLNTEIRGIEISCKKGNSLFASKDKVALGREARDQLSKLHLHNGLMRAIKQHGNKGWIGWM